MRIYRGIRNMSSVGRILSAVTPPPDPSARASEQALAAQCPGYQTNLIPFPHPPGVCEMPGNQNNPPPFSPPPPPPGKTPAPKPVPPPGGARSGAESARRGHLARLRGVAENGT